jgi:NNP family nitrate/nitrite transporter-like MFS transporter
VAVIDTAPTPLAPATKGRWITDWRPNDPEFWVSTGKGVARRNLAFSVLSEHIGFASLPTLVGALARIPYSLAIVRFGARTWTTVSALLLVIPLVALAALSPETITAPKHHFGTLLVAAALAGFGGGNFASSMTNINALYPEGKKGFALGLNAGAGNLGVAAVQLVGLAILLNAGIHHPRYLVGVYLPLVILAALMAWLFMDNLATMKNDTKALREVVKDGHTWVMSLLYIGTFGSFIGFGFAFGQVLTVTFKYTPVHAAELTFIGPLIGSVVRPVGGWLADRIGGALVTMVTFVLMIGATALVLTASGDHSLGLFMTGFIALFTLSGIGNGSAFKMIPAIFRAKGESTGLGGEIVELHARRMSGALMGIAGAIGALGGVLVNLAFRESFLHNKNADGAYVAFMAFYALCALVTFAVYLRPSSARLQGV